MNPTTIIIFATFVFANIAITIGEPSIQIFSKEPPNDTFSVILKASRSVVPEIHDEFFAVNYVCNYGGVWLTFREHNYTNGPWILAETGCQQYWYVFNPINSVWLLESSKNTAIPTINLFQTLWWSDVENSRAYTENQPIFTGAFNSTIVTGSDAVTFYSETNYGGRSVCLRPEVDSKTIYEGDMEKFGFQFGEIKSFRFGCFSSIVRHSNHMNTNRKLVQEAGPLFVM